MCDEKDEVLLAHGFTSEYVKRLAFEATGRNVEWVKACQVTSSATGTQAPLPFSELANPNLSATANEAFFGVVKCFTGIGAVVTPERVWAGNIVLVDDYNMQRPVTAVFSVFATNGLDPLDNQPAMPPMLFYKVAQMPALNVQWTFVGFRIRFTS